MTTVITVETDGDALWWSLQQLTTASALDAAFVEQCVALGLAEVSGAMQEWVFDAATQLRLERAWRLHRDLDLHPSALPLVLELLDEVEALRIEAGQLRARLRQWENENG